MQIETQTENRLSFTLEVVERSGKSFNYSLEDNSSVFVGSSSTCGLRLNGKGIEDIHCMLLMSEGQLKVHGWHTGSTLLNDTPIDEEAVLGQGDRLQIGPHQIIVGVAAAVAAVVPDDVEPNVESSPVQKLEQAQLQIQQLTDDTPTIELPINSPELQPEPAPMPVELEPEPLQLESDRFSVEPSPSNLSPVDDVLITDFSFDPNDDFDDPHFDTGSNASPDEILQREVEQLRMELSQRDSEIAELHERGSEALEDDETTVRLVNRLEDLLAELENSDRRVLELEQLLRLSDEATQAEREERSQLESWIREIETRVAQRESESEAQQERLQVKLDETRSQLQRAEAQVQRVLQSGVEEHGVADDSVVKELQHQNDELKLRLQSMADESQALQDQLENSNELEHARTEIQRLEQQMLQMEVETSRERAEIAREKAVVRRTQDEMEKQMRDQAEMSDSDTRLVAMRQHLRERYEKEKSDREEQRGRSLGGRISRLLKSVKK